MKRADQKSTERRREERFRVKEGIFVTVAPEFAKIGQMLDISRSGLAFRYVDSKEQVGERADLHVFSMDNGFRLFNLPCKIMNDIQDPEFCPTRHMVRTNRCGVQFGELTYPQRLALDQLIGNCTVGR